MTTTLSAPPGASAPSGEPPTDSGRPADPRWVRPSLIGLLLATAVLYLWGLGASGWANSYYSAAAQAGADSWKAFFFGSSDAANSITVDKTPASLWLMALSVKLFGLSSWSILVPQALAGVASVGVLYATVRRWFSPGAALLSGAVLATTPVAVLMFRFNNPDALLVLLLVLGAYAAVRATERASARWLVLAAVFVGFGFLTKMLQAFLVVPAFALVYLVAAPTSLRRRIRHVLLAGLALLGSAGWWVAIVELIPAQYRPYIGGSQDNSVLELMFGYNGLGRLTGEETGSVGGGAGWGETGWGRMFSAEIGGQVAWLLPAALVLLIAGLLVSRAAPRTSRTRAAYLLWGGWLVVTAGVFSFMAGIFHAYYTVALAPAIGALVGIGGTMLWRRRTELVAAATLSVTLAGTAVWSYVLLDRSADWYPWLRVLVLVAGLSVAGLLLLAAHLPGRVARGLAVAGVAVVLAGPVGYALNTAASPHSGAIPSAGPTVASAGFGGPGGARGGLPQGGFQQGGLPQRGPRQGGGVGMPQGGPANGGGMGGLLGGSSASDELVALLQQDAGSFTWAAATVGSNNAAGYQLASGEPVMSIGGFNGSDPSPTLEQFQEYVAEGRVHYFIGGEGIRADSGSATGQEIAAWVAENFAAVEMDGVTVYDLSGAAATTT